MPSAKRGYEVAHLVRKEEKKMSEHFPLGILGVIAADINLYGLIILRDAHLLTNETLLKTTVTMDLASKR